MSTWNFAYAWPVQRSSVVSNNNDISIIGKNRYQQIDIRGGSPPIWGRYGGLKFSTGVYFGLYFLETPSSDFGIFSPLDRGPPPLGTLKIWAKSDERNSRNVRPNLVYPTEYFRVVGRLCALQFGPVRTAAARTASDRRCTRPTPTTQSVAKRWCSVNNSILRKLAPFIGKHGRVTSLSHCSNIMVDLMLLTGGNSREMGWINQCI